MTAPDYAELVEALTQIADSNSDLTAPEREWCRDAAKAIATLTAERDGFARRIDALCDMAEHRLGVSTGAESAHDALIIALDQAEAERDAALKLLTEARDDVAELVERRRQELGNQLMRRQQPGIDLLAAIDAAIEVGK